MHYFGVLRRSVLFQSTSRECLLYGSGRARSLLSGGCRGTPVSNDRLKLCDNAGVEAATLFNIKMIDVRGSIEIYVGNPAPEAGPLSDNCVAGIMIDDLGDI